MQRKSVLSLAATMSLLGTVGAQAQEAPTVVASIKPIHSLVAGVMEGVGTPHLLVRGGASPHTYAMRPSDAQALQDATLVFWVGEDLETFLVGPLEAQTGLRTVELSAAPGMRLLPVREGGIWERHDHGDHAAEHDHDDHAHDDHDQDDHAHDDHAHDDHAHDDHAHDDHAHDDHAHDEHAHDDHAHDDHAHDDHAHDDHAHDDHGSDGHAHAEEHGHGEVDMHVWVGPDNAAAIIAAIAAALTEADPAHADRYQANAAALSDRLAELDAALAERLIAVQDRPYIVFHNAYQYFETHYGLSPAGSVTVSPEIRPGAARLAELRAHVQAQDAICVFSEPQFEPSLVETIVEGTGARAGELDPLGAALEDGPDLYFALLEGMVDGLRGCLLGES